MVFSSITIYYGPVHYMNTNQRDGLDLKVGKQIGAEVALGLEALHQAEQVHGGYGLEIY